jgi:hypothetical protein
MERPCVNTPVNSLSWAPSQFILAQVLDMRMESFQMIIPDPNHLRLSNQHLRWDRAPIIDPYYVPT